VGAFFPGNKLEGIAGTGIGDTGTSPLIYCAETSIDHVINKADKRNFASEKKRICNAIADFIFFILLMSVLFLF
jgi:hypothetical protein